MARAPKKTATPKPPKQPKAPPAGGGPGHNSGDLDDEHLQALHLNSHVPDYEKALKEKKDADANLRNVCKRIKSEGGSVDEIKLTIALRSPAGEAALKATIEQQMRVARWSGLPVGTQGDMFAPDVRPLSERAKQEGKIAGMRGDECRPPYDGGSDGYQPWVEGWHEGQAVLASKIKKPTAETGLIQGDKPNGTDSFDDAADKSQRPPKQPGGTDWPDDKQVRDRQPETEPA